MIVRKITVLPFACLLLLVYSCSSGKIPEQPVTDAEAQKIAKQIEDAVNAGNGSFIDKNINQQVFYQRVVHPVSGEELGISAKEFRVFFANMNLGSKISGDIKESGEFRLLHIAKKDGKQHLLYRVFADDGMNYYDMELTKVSDKVGIADIYIYLSGQNISETAHDLITELMKYKTRGSVEANTQGMEKLRYLLKQEKYKEVVDIVNDMPENIQNVKGIMAVKIIALSRYDSALFDQALKEFRERFPGEDKKMGLMIIDGLLMQKKYDQIQSCLNDLDEQLGGDPVLDLLRSNVFYQDGKPDSSIFYLQRLVQRMPDFEEGYSQLVLMYYVNGEEAKAKQFFRECRDKQYLKSKTLQSLEDAYPSLKN